MPVLIQLNAVVIGESEEAEIQVGRELATALALPMKQEELRQRVSFHGATAVIIIDDLDAAKASAMIAAQLRAGLEQGAPTATLTDTARKIVDDLGKKIMEERRRKERPGG